MYETVRCGFYSRKIFIATRKLNKLQLNSISESPNTVRQCPSVHFLCSSCKRVYTQWCPTQDCPSNDQITNSDPWGWHGCTVGRKWWHCCIVVLVIIVSLQRQFALSCHVRIWQSCCVHLEANFKICVVGLSCLYWALSYIIYHFM
jgi:hypothetical protein